MSDQPYVITQVGSNENDPIDEALGYTMSEEGAEALTEAAREIAGGLKKFRNGIIFKVGMVVVAVKGLSILGQIFTEIEKTKRMAMEHEKERSEKS